MKDRTNRPEPVTRLGAWLHLKAALQWAADYRLGSQWEDRDWRRAIDGLMPTEVAIVTMHAIRGMTFLQIAEWLGISRSAVGVRWQKIATRLRDNMREDCK